MMIYYWNFVILSFFFIYGRILFYRVSLKNVLFFFVEFIYLFFCFNFKLENGFGESLFGINFEVMNSD